MRLDRPPCKFHLSRKPDKEGLDLLIIRNKWGVDKYHVSSRVKVPPQCWDHANQKVIRKRGIAFNYRSANDRLDAARVAYNKFFEEVKIGTKKPRDFKDYMKAALRGKRILERSQSRLFIGYLEGFIKRKLSPSNQESIKGYESLRKLLVAFRDEESRQLIYEDIDVLFSQEFAKFMRKRGAKVGYIKKQLSRVKFVMEEARQSDLHSSDKHNSKRFMNVAYSDFKNPYQVLYPYEIDALLKLDLSKEPMMKAVRDLFVIGCMTGLRVSDYTALHLGQLVKVKDGNMIEEYRLKTPNQKTTKQVGIPVAIGSDLLRLLKEYCREDAPRITKAYVTKHIKTICKRAGITEQVTEMHKEPKTVNGQLHEETKKRSFPKYQKISSHTARRSYVTNRILLEPDISLQTIREVTGHSKDSDLLNYIHIDKSIGVGNIRKTLLQRSKEVS